MRIKTTAGKGEFAGFIPAKRLTRIKILVAIEPFSQRDPVEVMAVPFFECVNEQGNFLIREVMKIDEPK